MPLICYVPKKFTAAHQLRIQQANTIIRDYQAQGYDLTLRQLYYQFVARDLIPNNQKEYKNLGGIINDARLAGLIDWHAITDRTRNLRSLGHFESPADVVNAAAYSFRYDKWADQPNKVEVWVEKDALVGVLERVCNELDVPYFSCRGYTSQSEMWAAGRRLKASATDTYILHFGDHDPSGKDMSRDIADRLEMFSEGDVSFERLALNMDQVEQYNPPANPAKLTDARATAYIQEFGDESWELDALEPSVIASLIRDRVIALRDEELWQEAVAKEEEARENLTWAAKNWETVNQFIDDQREYA